MQGCVFSLEEFSVYDGPGIRTTVFLKGCPLRCEWCHNPEGQQRDPEIVRSPNGCAACGQCERYAVIQSGTRRFTEDSIKHCPKGLLRVCGEPIEHTALCEKLLKNRPLLQGGGVAFSGGEPLMQPDFLFACLRELKGTLHTAVQTCGYGSEAVFAKALALADYVLFDLKLINDAQHKRYTGVSNQSILKNFAALAQSGKEFVVRIPLIPAVTDTAENITDIAKLLNRHGVHYVELLPYNKMAGGKYALLGQTYAPTFDETRPVTIPQDILEAHNITFQVL